GVQSSGVQHDRSLGPLDQFAYKFLRVLMHSNSWAHSQNGLVVEHKAKCGSVQIFVGNCSCRRLRKRKSHVLGLACRDRRQQLPRTRESHQTGPRKQRRSPCESKGTALSNGAPNQQDMAKASFVSIHRAHQGKTREFLRFRPPYFSLPDFLNENGGGTDGAHFE